MKDKFIPYMEPSYGAEEKRAVADYLNSGGWLAEFKKTEEFERMICQFTGAKHCSVVSNGTVSLILSLMALDIGRGDEVIVPDLTFIATANAVRFVGAKPVLVDVDQTLCLDPKLFEKAINKKTKAVIFVPLNGRAGRIDEVKHICKIKKISLIEDAAQALGSSYRGKQLGRLGVFGSFSFSSPKIITTGNGGALITNSSKLYQRVERMKDFGRIKQGVDIHEEFGGDFKFTDLQAVFGIEQFKKLPKRVKRKKEIYALYRKLLKGVKQITFVPTDLNDAALCYIDILVVAPKKLAAYLKDRNIGTKLFSPAIHTQKIYRTTKGKFPVATHAARHGIWLPSSTLLSNEDIKRICLAIGSFYNPNKQ